MKKIRRFLSLLTAAVLLAALLPAQVLAAPTDYGLTIAGVRVTSDNWYDPLHNGVFQYMYNAKSLVVAGDYAADSAIDTLIESDVDGLEILMWGNYTLSMSNSGGTFLKLGGDTSIRSVADNIATSLTLVNENPGGTGILADNCALSVVHTELNIRGVDYGMLGQGANAALTYRGRTLRVLALDTAVSGFTKGLELIETEMLAPENGKVSAGAICSKDGHLSPDAELRTTSWDSVFQSAGYSWQPELSTRGEKNPETNKYEDYDIDMIAALDGNWLEMQSYNILKGSLPDGMSLAFAPSDAYSSHNALRLQGKPAVPGSYELWLLITGLNDTAVRQTMAVKVRLGVTYEWDMELYDLWIDGLRVDSSHLTMGDGAFSFDPDAKTLTIRKSYAQSWPGALIRSGIAGLIVDIPEDVVLSSEGTAFQLEKAARFRGDGRLTIRSSEGDGIRMSGGAMLTLQQADLDVEAAGVAVAGCSGDERLWLEDVQLTAKGGTEAVAGFTGGITLHPADTTKIKFPAGGKTDSGSIVRSDGSPTAEAVVSTAKSYGLKIAGVTVSEDNRRDVLGDGVFSFDGEKTLTVSGSYTMPEDFSYAYTDIIGNDSIEGLVIAAAKDSTLTISPAFWGYVIRTERKTTITGPGRLVLITGTSSFNPAISAGADLTLKDIDLTARGYGWAIQGTRMYPSKLIVENSSVHASTASSVGNPALSDFLNGIELTGSVIAEPQNGTFQEWRVVAPDGTSATNVVILTQKPVAGVSLDRTSLTLAAGSSKSLTAALTPADASNQALLWESDDPSIASVDALGTVTGVAEGTATVTVKTADGGKTAACEVIVTAPIHVTGVSLSSSKMSIAKGSAAFLAATVSPDNATDKSVTWQSSDPAVAAVDASGMVTGVSEGTATITVKSKDGAKTAQCQVTVTPGVPVTGVKIEPEEMTLAFGASGTLTAVISPANATNQAVSWTSSDLAVAKVGLTGIVTGLSAGTATITATTVDGGKTAVCAVTVDPPVPVSGVTLDKATLTLVAGQSPFDQETLKATVKPDDAADKEVTWSTSDFEVASVYDGVVKGKKKGTADITVRTKDGAKTAVCRVTVIDPVHVTGISLDPALALYAGTSRTLTPVFTPADATNKLVIWSSSDEGIVKVNSYGVVTAVSAGTAAVTAQTVDGGKTKTCIVTVTFPWSFDKASKTITAASVITPASPLIAASYDGSGRFLGLTVMTGAGKYASAVKAGAKTVSIFWLDQATGIPKCESEQAILP